ncbi:GntR family transcriptional regulator, partial [Enterococcus faecalis]|nr:GntR family transcriptional regulator [Enterococcus faecalis]
LEATISEMNFWQNTSATIIAIKHKEELLVSPGPYAKISLNDTHYFVEHDESTLQLVQNFIYP